MIEDFFTDPLRQTQLIQTAVVLASTVVLWWLFVRGVGRAVERMGRGDGVEAAEQRQRVETLWKAGRRVAGAAGAM